VISHARFGKLRLSQFRPNTNIVALDGWEFMDHLWVGEAIGFSEWLRLKRKPDELRSLAIDFSEFPEQAATEVLRMIELPIRGGMTSDELQQLFGKPAKESSFVKDRVSYQFVSSGSPKYNLSCTVLNKGGLTYLVVAVPLPQRRG
jgi:hypothetical protein